MRLLLLCCVLCYCCFGVEWFDVFVAWLWLCLCDCVFECVCLCVGAVFPVLLRVLYCGSVLCCVAVRGVVRCVL